MLSPVNFEALYQAQRQQPQADSPKIITPSAAH
jgi:preprotein translocase subunit SecB